MTAAEMTKIIDFEDSLQIGSPVRIRWTNSFKDYDGVGTIIKINDKTFKVALTAPVPNKLGSDYGPYPVGRVLSAPRACGGRTFGNCVEPVDGY